MKRNVNAVEAAGGPALAPARLAGVLALAALAGLASMPAAAQTVTLTKVGEIPGPAEHIRVQGDHAYVSHHSSFTVWDVSDPAAPVRMGATELQIGRASCRERV